MKINERVMDGASHNHPDGRWYVARNHHIAGESLPHYKTRADARQELQRRMRVASRPAGHPLSRRCGCDACYAGNLQRLGANG